MEGKIREAGTGDCGASAACQPLCEPRRRDATAAAAINSVTAPYYRLTHSARLIARSLARGKLDDSKETRKIRASPDGEFNHEDSEARQGES